MRGEAIVRPSPNQAPRTAGTVIDLLVLHYTGMSSGAAALARLCEASAEVSAHYLVEEDGTVYALVPESQRAWHAGVSQWRGQGDVNNRSIGVEIVNPGHEFGYRAFPKAQVAAVIALCQEILARHPAIVPRNVVAHSDIAPWRKEDPGELFPWSRLAQAGVGLWPSAADSDSDSAKGTVGDWAQALADWGYPLAAPSSPEAALAAFHRRYLPHKIPADQPLARTAQADAQTWAALCGLLSFNPRA